LTTIWNYNRNNATKNILKVSNEDENLLQKGVSVSALLFPLLLDIKAHYQIIFIVKIG
jgi:hypothetical protein